MFPFGVPTNSLIKSAVATIKSENMFAQPLTVETLGNHIYFYADVDGDRCLAMLKAIRETDNYLRTERLSRGVDHETPIWLHIMSGGGDLFAGMAAADQLAQMKTPIYSVVEGYCASAATFISMACTKRFIHPNSFMLIHQFTSFFYGTYEKFKDEKVLQDKLMERMINFYMAHSKLTEERIREILTHDTWFDSDEAIELGLVDSQYHAG